MLRTQGMEKFHSKKKKGEKKCSFFVLYSSLVDFEVRFCQCAYYIECHLQKLIFFYEYDPILKWSTEANF